MSSKTELVREQNPNLTLFEQEYRRRLHLPPRFDFGVQTKVAMFRRLVKRLPPLPERAAVLDLGSGYGEMLFWWPRHCELAGVDITPAAVARVRREAGRRGYRAFRFECLDLEREPLRWADASVDVVICSHLIEHVADDHRLLAQIRRVLKPGGHLILMIPIHDPDHHPNPLHLHRYTEQSVQELLVEYNLRVVAEDKDNTLTNVFERIGGPALPRPLEVLRGKTIGVLGAISLFVPKVWNLRWWGPPRSYGVLARRETRRQGESA